MLTPYRGSSTASSPSQSGQPILVSLSGGGIPAGSIFQDPQEVTFGQSPYQIPDAVDGTTPPVRTYIVATNAGAVEIDLPVTPVEGEVVIIKRETTDGATLTIGRSAKKIDGATSNVTDVNTALSSYVLQYDSVLGSWWIESGIGAFRNLVVTGDVTLGDASADTLNINGGVIQLGANVIVARAAGTIATGSVNITSWNSQVTGDSGGASSPRGLASTLTTQGANNFSVASANLFSVVHAGGGTIAAARVFSSFIQVTGGGTITIADNFATGAPTLTSGTIVTVNGFRASLLGAAGITTSVAFKADDMSNSTNMRGLQSSLTAGAGKFNLYLDGTADNTMAGPLYCAQDGKTLQTAAAIYAGTGAPNNANGNNGDFYLRGDGTVAAHTILYHKQAGAWVASAA